MNKYELHINLRYKSRHLSVIEEVINNCSYIEYLDYVDDGNVVIYTLKCSELKIKILVNRIERRIGKRNMLAIYNQVK